MNDYCQLYKTHPLHEHCHNHSYGFPVHDDNLLYGRLLLEIFQAGLSWLIVLRKEDALQKAFADFDYTRVAKFNDDDVMRLMTDSTIIRNRRKIAAAISNAQVLVALKKTHGSFKDWLNAHHPRSLDQWRLLFRKTFTFTGPIVVHEFLMSTGYLEGAHAKECPVYRRILALKPPWTQS